MVTLTISLPCLLALHLKLHQQYRRGLHPRQCLRPHHNPALVALRHPHYHFGDILEATHRVCRWDKEEDCFPFQTQLHECSLMEFRVISQCLYEYYKSLWPFQPSSRSQDIVITSYPSQWKNNKHPYPR